MRKLIALTTVLTLCMGAASMGVPTISHFKATPHKDRLTALHMSCLHLFRHLAQKSLDIRQYACGIFG